MLTNLHTKAAFAEGGISRDLHVSKEVAILGVSIYAVGLGELILYAVVTLTTRS